MVKTLPDTSPGPPEPRSSKASSSTSSVARPGGRTFVDVRGTNTSNKGAELMLRAVCGALDEHATLACSPSGTSFDVRSRLGLWQLLQAHRAPRLLPRVDGAVPRTLRERYGLVREAEVSAAVDASGFGYSDSFGVARPARELRLARLRDARGVPRIFLPQAFGPFTNPELRALVPQLFQQARLIYARDSTSRHHLAQLLPRHDIRLAPDFTVGLVGGDLPARRDEVLLVPNSKVVSTGVAGEAAYVAAFVAAGRRLASEGLSPVVLVHETTDRALATSIGSSLGCEVISDGNALTLKGHLGRGQLVLTSRYHAAVGSLSQGVATVVLGWSHKYRHLLEDFGCPHWLAGSPGELPDLAAVALHDEVGQQRLLERRELVLGASRQMWDEVRAAL